MIQTASTFYTLPRLGIEHHNIKKIYELLVLNTNSTPSLFCSSDCCHPANHGGIVSIFACSPSPLVSSSSFISQSFELSLNSLNAVVLDENLCSHCVFIKGTQKKFRVKVLMLSVLCHFMLMYSYIVHTKSPFLPHVFLIAIVGS